MVQEIYTSSNLIKVKIRIKLKSYYITYFIVIYEH